MPADIMTGNNIKYNNNLSLSNYYRCYYFKLNMFRKNDGNNLIHFRNTGFWMLRKMCYINTCEHDWAVVYDLIWTYCDIDDENIINIK